MKFALALIIAVNYWGDRGLHVPCHPVAVPNADALMPVAYGLPVPMVFDVDGCRVLISSQGAWLRRAGPNWYCADVVHEVGHLAGLQHRARGVMSAEVGLTDIPRDCAQWYRTLQRLGVRR